MVMCLCGAVSDSLQRMAQHYLSFLRFFEALGLEFRSQSCALAFSAFNPALGTFDSGTGSCEGIAASGIAAAFSIEAAYPARNTLHRDSVHEQLP